MQRLTAGVLLAVALTVTSCGSTVRVNGGAAGVPGSSDLGGGTAVGAGSLDTGGTTTGVVDGSAPGQVSPGYVSPTGGAQVPGTSSSPVGGGTATSGPSAGGGATGAPVAGGSKARGVTDKTITFGIAIATGTEAAADALGISGAGAVPEEDMWRAMVNEVNASGGILGRKLVLYTHSVDLASFVANPAQTYAEICSDFRDDHPVFTAFITISDAAVQTCLAKMGTPFVVYGANVGSIIPKKSFDDFGGSYLYAPGGITQERVTELFVDSLVERRFTEKWDTVNGRPGVMPLKIGMIHADNPEQNAYYAAHKRELAKHGLTVSDTVTYAGDVSTALAATQGAVLKFASEGITHVFGASAFFLRYAESQRYRPRYAYIPGLGALGASNSPPEQLAGALSVGWAPAQDVEVEQDPGPNPGAAHCKKVMRGAGLSMNNRSDLKLMLAVCDGFYSWRDALTRSRSISVAGLRTGYESLGRGFAPALTFSTVLGRGRHYGTDSVRDMAYDTACTCLKYTSRTNRS